MKFTQDHFTFPIVMVDGENEERKEKKKEQDSNLFNKPEPVEVEYDIVYGEASYPYFDFVGFEDRWLPTKRSLRRALQQKFDACMVRFANIGQFLVPMSKEKFLEAIEEFAAEREKPPVELPVNATVVKFTPELLAQLIAKQIEGSDEKEGE